MHLMLAEALVRHCKPVFCAVEKMRYLNKLMVHHFLPPEKMRKMH